MTRLASLTGSLKASQSCITSLSAFSTVRISQFYLIISCDSCTETILPVLMTVTLWNARFVHNLLFTHSPSSPDNGVVDFSLIGLSVAEKYRSSRRQMTNEENVCTDFV